MKNFGCPSWGYCTVKVALPVDFSKPCVFSLTTLKWKQKLNYGDTVYGMDGSLYSLSSEVATQQSDRIVWAHKSWPLSLQCMQFTCTVRVELRVESCYFKKAMLKLHSLCLNLECCTDSTVYVKSHQHYIVMFYYFVQVCGFWLMI